MLLLLLDKQGSLWAPEPLLVIMKPQGEKPAKNGANNLEVYLRN